MPGDGLHLLRTGSGLALVFSPDRQLRIDRNDGQLDQINTRLVDRNIRKNSDISLGQIQRQPFIEMWKTTIYLSEDRGPQVVEYKEELSAQLNTSKDY